MTADDDKTGGFGLTGPAYSRLEALGIARMRMHQRELDALRALLSAAREAEAALASMTIDRDSWAEQADQRAAEAAEYLTRTQKAEAALAEEREARERAERELAAAVEFHLHALDATYRCLPLGKPDTEPDRWVAIAHRMTKLEAALLLIRDGEGDAQDIAWNALESALRAAPAQREKGDDDAAL